MGFHFGKLTRLRAAEAHWITPKHYAHCTVHIARRIWETVDGDRLKWMGAPSEWPTLDTFDLDTTVQQGREHRLTIALHDNGRAVSAAIDVMNRYARRTRVERQVGEQLRRIHHRYRWIDAKQPGWYASEVREAFYAILDAKETRAAYEYVLSVSGAPVGAGHVAPSR